MKRGPNIVRRWNEGSHRLQLVGASSPAGFSLIELLVVVAILLLLVTLYWGGGGSDSRQRQAQQDCRTHLQRIYIALNIYAGEHGGKFPASTNAHTAEEALEPLVPRYMADTTVFICPGLKNPPAPAGDSFRQQHISYSYYMGRDLTAPGQVLMSDQQVNDQSKMAGAYVFSGTGKPPGNNHGKLGGNVLLCDGSASGVPPRLSFSLMLTQGVVLLNPNSK